MIGLVRHQVDRWSKTDGPYSARYAIGLSGCYRDVYGCTPELYGAAIKSNGERGKTGKDTSVCMCNKYIADPGLSDHHTKEWLYSWNRNCDPVIMPFQHLPRSLIIAERYVRFSGFTRVRFSRFTILETRAADIPRQCALPTSFPRALQLLELHAHSPFNPPSCWFPRLWANRRLCPLWKLAISMAIACQQEY